MSTSEIPNMRQELANATPETASAQIGQPGDILDLDLTVIQVLNRGRELGSVDELAKSIQAVGLLQPIVVDVFGRLVAGRHRLEAARKLDWKTIRALVIGFDDDLHRELAELDENLVRNDVTALERVKLMDRRKQIYETLYPATRHGAAPGKKGGGKVASASKDPDSGSFVDATARATGRSRSTIAEEATLGAKISDEAAAILKGHPIENNKSDLKDFAKIPKKEQAAVAQALVDDPMGTIPVPQAEPTKRPPIFDDIPQIRNVKRLLKRTHAAVTVLANIWRDGHGPDVKALRPRVAHTLKTIEALEEDVRVWLPERPCDKCDDPRSPKRRCKQCAGCGWLPAASNARATIHPQQGDKRAAKTKVRRGRKS